MKGFLDIETGGFSITKNGVCEIALIAVNGNNEIVDSFHALIKPYTREDGSDELVSYKDDAMAVNGIALRVLIKNGCLVTDVMSRLEKFIRFHNVQTIIGHNSNAFDIPRVEYLLNRFAGFSLSNLGKEDTMQMAKAKLNLPSYKLESLCEHFGIVNTNQHSAVGDATATFELYLELTS